MFGCDCKSASNSRSIKDWMKAYDDEMNRLRQDLLSMRQFMADLDSIKDLVEKSKIYDPDHTYVINYNSYIITAVPKNAPVNVWHESYTHEALKNHINAKIAQVHAQCKPNKRKK